MCRDRGRQPEGYVSSRAAKPGSTRPYSKSSPSKAPNNLRITREIKSQRGLRHTNYTNVSRRVRALEELSYLDKAGRRKTQAGTQAALYQLTLRAHVAVLLNQFNPETLIEEAYEDTLIAELVALIQPRDIASRLKEYRLKPWNVTQRIRRMNEKLDSLIGQKAAGKRDKGWALTTFLRQAWGSTKEELADTDPTNQSG